MPRIRTLFTAADAYVAPSPVTLAIRSLSFAVAAGCFAWVGAMFAEQYLHQKQLREAFEPYQTQDGAERATPPPALSALARLRIARVDLDAMVEEGFDAATLRRAVGHAPGSARPGQRGNIVLAAHRDTFFAGLRHVREGDLIQLQSSSGRELNYRVRRILVVKPTDSWVMRSTPNRDQLTLITCYPFQYVGNAPERLVVQAEPVRQRGNVV
jgi:sortase A